MMQDETRPVAIVTGSASGIGAATARKLADSGFDVAINFARNASGADAVAQDCRNAGSDSIAIQADVAADNDCKRLVGDVLECFGRVDVLVNNAGTTKFASPHKLDALDAEDFARLQSVNVTGCYQMIRAARDALKVSPIASIINISSHSGFSGLGSSIAYASTKGALNTMTLSLARALAPEIRVNAICPGYVDTPWHEKADMLKGDRLEALKQKMKDIAPLGRMTEADDVAEAVGWLALGGKAITGVLLVIDGGTHLTIGTPH